MANPERALTNSRAAAAYVAELTGNLAEIARKHGLETLSFLLEMARLEAEQGAQAAGDGDGRS